MSPSVTAVLKRAAALFARWWMRNRPLSKESREARQDRRDLKRELKAQGLSRKEIRMKLSELFALFAQRRTSTKAGAAGLAPLIVLAPFYDEINGLLLEACQSEHGPAVFLVGGAIVWVTMFVSARFSKTPANPGVL